MSQYNKVFSFCPTENDFSIVGNHTKCFPNVQWKLKANYLHNKNIAPHPPPNW